MTTSDKTRSSMIPWRTLAVSMANASRTHTCLGTTYGQWPAFVEGAKFVSRECRVCRWIVAVDLALAQEAIVQQAVGPVDIQRGGENE